MARIGRDNVSEAIMRVASARFVEAGAGTYNFDVFVPAGAIILDIIVAAEALWTAATSAALNVGDYAASEVNGYNKIGSAIDADGFFSNVNLKATDLTQGQHLTLTRTGGMQGVYLPSLLIGSDVLPTQFGDVHALQLVDGVDRYVRFQVVSVGAGTAGRTYVALYYAMPPAKDIGL